jgi:hypothetical protein
MARKAESSCEDDMVAEAAAPYMTPEKGAGADGVQQVQSASAGSKTCARELILA